MVPREEKLRIVGIVETEPASGFGGVGRGRVLIPLQVAEKLRVAQTNDFRTMLGARPGKNRLPEPHRPREEPGSGEGRGRRDQAHGLCDFFPARRDEQSPARSSPSSTCCMGIFGSLALIVASLGIINTLVMAILERRREIGVLKALGAADGDIRKAVFRGSGRDGAARRTSSASPSAG